MFRLIYSTPKSSSTNVKPGDLDTSMDFKLINSEKLETNDKTSIISLVRISLLYVKYVIL